MCGYYCNVKKSKTKFTFNIHVFSDNIENSIKSMKRKGYEIVSYVPFVFIPETTENTKL